MGKLNKTQQKKYRPILLDLCKRLGGKLTRMEEAVLLADGDSSPDESDEFGSDGYTREFQLGLIENEDEILQLVREALDRIDEGSYGVCDACDDPIPARRLEALPYARYCVACQSKAEDGTLGDD